jgi:hypothetical protein
MSAKQSFLPVFCVFTAFLCGCGGGGGGGGGSGGQTAAPPAAGNPPAAQAPQAFSSGKWSAPDAFSSAEPFNASNSVAVDNLGTTTFVVSAQSQSSIVVKALRKALHAPWDAEEALTPPVPIQGVGSRQFRGVQVRVDDAGNAIAAWTFLDTENLDSRSHISTVSARRRATDTGLWSIAVSLQSDPSAFARDVHVAVEADGTAWAVWTERIFKDPLIPLNDRYRIFARKFTPPSTWSAAEPVSPEFTGFPST